MFFHVKGITYDVPTKLSSVVNYIFNITIIFFICLLPDVNLVKYQYKQEEELRKKHRNYLKMLNWIISENIPTKMMNVCIPITVINPKTMDI